MSRRRPDGTTSAYPTSYNLQGPCYGKLLLPDKVAGSVIGRGGQVLQEFEQQSGMMIKVSPPKVFFPTTSERMVMVSGEFNRFASVVDFILEKIIFHGADANGMTMRVTVPNSSVVNLIGKGGEIIREIQHRTGASLHVCERIDNIPETIMEVKGPKPAILDAIQDVLHVIQSNPQIREIVSEYYTNVPGGVPSRNAPHLPHHAHSPPPQPLDPTTNPELLAYPLTIEFVIPSHSADYVQGENGRYLEYIYLQTGAVVSIEEIGNTGVDQPPPADVNIRIKGPLCGVQAAHMLVIKKVTDVLLSHQ